jgi:nitrate/nitrite-specific signal transduction histidine kinase
MAKELKNKKKLLNLVVLSKLSGVSYFTIWRSVNNKRDKELSLDERSKIAKAINDSIAPELKSLGFDITITRL